MRQEAVTSVTTVRPEARGGAGRRGEARGEARERRGEARGRRGGSAGEARGKRGKRGEARCKFCRLIGASEGSVMAAWG